ncbi:DNA methyltransferase [Amaricoccus sp.]|uniref:DNA methyltransferase n=1 Tax=Amaricoccus sp. TaxID=1872485 RepID=UPI001B4A6048|nr:DNA methyltransferase [Amaricoccus sp.]MBP7001694.1 site-specific DNA-methyltransferase [Amaricoccus sp.]
MTAPITLHRGDAIEVVADLAPDTFDAIVTDPPYHLTSIVKRFGGATAKAAGEGSDGAFARASRGFMGKTWDGGDLAFRAGTWAAFGRVLKPGGYLVAFNHSRTWHRMTVAIEDAGFEVRDSIADLYATGPAWADFLDSLGPDQARAFARAVAGGGGPMLAWLYGTGMPKSHSVARMIDKALGVEGSLGAPKSAAHAAWIKRGAMRGGQGAEGWQRPWMEDPEAVEAQAREYLPGSAEAQAFDGWGTALKPAIEPIVLARKPLAEGSIARQHLATGTGGLHIDAAKVPGTPRPGADPEAPPPAPRWPANVTTDASREVLARFPLDAEGSVARFFYSAKADAADKRGSDHPTVKPHALMRWLVRLVSARGGLILDPFGGSGATAWAAQAEGRRCVLIERDPGYADHIAAVIAGGLDAPEPEVPAGRGQLSLF